MELLPPDIQKYVDRHTTAESELLAQLNRHTHAHVLQARMLSGHVQGRFLAMISQMLSPKLIVEIGTYTGYSALCLAEGLANNGKLITMDVNEELQATVQSFFDRSAYNNHIQFLIGDAADLIPSLADGIDLAFIDADKKSNRKYYDMLLPKMRTNGIILADNVLWSGKVAQEGKIDKDTQTLIDFNEYVHNDPRVENLLLPLRDGIMMLRKR